MNTNSIIVIAIFSIVFLAVAWNNGALTPLSGDKSLGERYADNQKAYDHAVIETEKTPEFKEEYFKCINDFNGYFKADWQNHNWSSAEDPPLSFDPYCRIQIKQNVWQTFHMVKKQDGWELLDDKIFPNDGDGKYE